MSEGKDLPLKIKVSQVSCAGVTSVGAAQSLVEHFVGPSDEKKTHRFLLLQEAAQSAS